MRRVGGLRTHISRFSSCSEFLVRDALTLLKVSRKETGILDEPGILSVLSVAGRCLRRGSA